MTVALMDQAHATYQPTSRTRSLKSTAFNTNPTLPSSKFTFKSKKNVQKLHSMHQSNPHLLNVHSNKWVKKKNMNQITLAIKVVDRVSGAQ